MKNDSGTRSDGAATAAVAECWCGVLGLDAVDEEDEFFRVGGTSLELIHICLMLNDRGYDVDLAAVTGDDRLSVRRMATHCRPTRPATGAAASRPMELFQLPFHRRSFATEDEHRDQFVTLMSFFVECGDIGRMPAAFEKLIRVHDALRVASVVEDGRWKMFLRDAGEYAVRFVDGRGLDPDALEARTREAAATVLGRLDIGAPRLLAAVAVQHGDLEHQVLMYVHHCVCDGIAAGILRDQIRGYLAGAEASIRPGPVSYVEYLSTVESYARTPTHMGILADWTRRPEVTARHPIVIDHPDGANFGELVQFHADSFALPRRDPSHATVELLAIGAAALATSPEGDWQRLALTHHGRLPPLQGLNVTATVGFFLQHAQLVIDLPRLRRESLAYLGDECDRMKSMALDAELLLYQPDRYRESMPSPPKPRIFFLYRGEVEDERGMALARAAMGARVWSAKVVKDFELFVSVWLDRRRATLFHRWECSRAQYEGATIRGIMDRFRSAFYELADGAATDGSRR